MSVTVADPTYTIAQNLRWFALVYLVALVLTGALAACDRTRCGPVAPAAGLYLARVDYQPRAAADNGGNIDED